MSILARPCCAVGIGQVSQDPLMRRASVAFLVMTSQDRQC
jgi:hypothetical protein